MSKTLRFPVVSRKRRRPFLNIEEVKNIKTKTEVETSQENFLKKKEEKQMLATAHVGPLFCPKKRRKKIMVKEIFRRFFASIFYKPQPKTISGSENGSAKVLPKRVLF